MDDLESTGALLASMTWEAKVMLWLLGWCDRLSGYGMLTGPVTLGELGRAMFQALEASGFRPSDAEVRRVIAQEVVYAPFVGTTAVRH